MPLVRLANYIELASSLNHCQSDQGHIWFEHILFDIYSEMGSGQKFLQHKSRLSPYRFFKNNNTITNNVIYEGESKITESYESQHTNYVNINKNRLDSLVVERPLRVWEVVGSIPGRVIPKT